MKASIRPARKPFRAFCWNKYFENRDEYESCGQRQPYSFEQYLWSNIRLLKEKYRLTMRHRGAIV